MVVGEATGPDKYPGSIRGSTNVKLIFCKERGLLLGTGASVGESIREPMKVIAACIERSVTAYDISKS